MILLTIIWQYFWNLTNEVHAFCISSFPGSPSYFGDPLGFTLVPPCGLNFTFDIISETGQS